MGNKPNRAIQQDYQTMVEDAVSALKERPGSTQTDIFKYLETKYQGRLPPKMKKTLSCKLRLVLKRTRVAFKRPGRPPGARKPQSKRKNGSWKRRLPGRGRPFGKKMKRNSTKLKRGRPSLRRPGSKFQTQLKKMKMKSQALKFKSRSKFNPKLHYRPIMRQSRTPKGRLRSYRVDTLRSRDPSSGRGKERGRSYDNKNYDRDYDSDSLNYGYRD